MQNHQDHVLRVFIPTAYCEEGAGGENQHFPAAYNISAQPLTFPSNTADGMKIVFRTMPQAGRFHFFLILVTPRGPDQDRSPFVPALKPEV